MDLRDFDRASRSAELPVLARLLLQHRTIGHALDAAERERAPERVQRVLKQAVPAGTLSTVEPSAGLGISSNAFFAAVRTDGGAFDNLFPVMRQLSFDQPGIRVSTQAISGAAPGEAKAKPISSFVLDHAGITRTKAAAVVVLSDTALALSAPELEALVSAELRAGVQAATDAAFLAGLITGLSPISATGSGSAADVLADLENLADAVQANSRSNLFVVAPADTVRSLAFKGDGQGALAFPQMTVSGGSIQGVRILPSDDLPVAGSPAAPLIVMVDAPRIAAASSPMGFDIARHASVELETAPTGDGSTGTGAEVVSLWQNNLAGLRAERALAFHRTDATAVATLAGATW